MKAAPFLFALSLLTLTACRTTTTPAPPDTSAPTPAAAGQDTPETVLVTYHVQPGRENAFPAVLARAWDIYRHARLVRSEPHIIVKEREEDGKTCFVELFTWVSHAAPNKAIAAVQGIWSEEMSACEARNGHRPLEGGEVELLTH